MAGRASGTQRSAHRRAGCDRVAACGHPVPERPSCHSAGSGTRLPPRPSWQRPVPRCGHRNRHGSRPTPHWPSGCVAGWSQRTSTSAQC